MLSPPLEAGHLVHDTGAPPYLPLLVPVAHQGEARNPGLALHCMNRDFIGPADCNHCNCNHMLISESSSCQ